MGLFAGSLTNTATLQAAIDASGSSAPSIGYSASYPFGVIGPILCLFVLARLIKPRLAPAVQPLHPLEITLKDRTTTPVADFRAQLPDGVELVAIRQGGANILPGPDTCPAGGDGVLLMGSRDSLEQVQLAFGAETPGRLSSDRGNLDVVRLLVSRPAFIGLRLDQIRFPAGISAKIAEVWSIPAAPGRQLPDRIPAHRRFLRCSDELTESSRDLTESFGFSANGTKFSSAPPNQVPSGQDGSCNADGQRATGAGCRYHFRNFRGFPTASLRPIDQFNLRSPERDHTF